MYNLTSKVETQITTNTADQGPCAIYGDIVVWQDYRDSSWNYDSIIGLSIYIYNLTAHTEQRLPTTEHNAYSPRISGDSVVYAAENYVTSYPFVEVYPYVCSYNLSTGLKTNVVAFDRQLLGRTGISSYSTLPIESVAVGEDLVAWSESDIKIVVKNVLSGSAWESPSEYYKNPTVGGGRFVVYQSYDAGYWHINVYDSFYGRDDQLTSALGHQINPKMSPTNPNFVVYQDDRSGLWHIYVSAFWYSVMGGGTPDPPITSSYVIDYLQETKSHIVDISTSDFAGVNEKVKENRKNAMLHQFDSAIADIEAAAYTQNLKLRTKYLQWAINQLDGLIVKLDGFSSGRGADTPGSGFTPDWITTPQYNDQVIKEYRNWLQMLLNGIT